MEKDKPTDSTEIKRLTATVHPDAVSFLEGWTRTNKAYFSSVEKLFKKK